MLQPIAVEGGDLVERLDISTTDADDRGAKPACCLHQALDQPLRFVKKQTPQS